MALQSMTGFARASAELNGAAIAWEVKSVNGKSLEARLRLPPGFERIEQTRLRAAVLGQRPRLQLGDAVDERLES